ncbi:MAG: hypothetical protein HQ557_18955 [Bacteroidetes bacterium]|nr:hypothetical protein [Bacteroidota bacterium]
MRISGQMLNDYSQHLTACLHTQGYDSYLCGIQHEAKKVEDIGYTRVLGNQNYDMSDFGIDSKKWDRDNANIVADF